MEQGTGLQNLSDRIEPLVQSCWKSHLNSKSIRTAGPSRKFSNTPYKQLGFTQPLHSGDITKDGELVHALLLWRYPEDANRGLAVWDSSSNATEGGMPHSLLFIQIELVHGIHVVNRRRKDLDGIFPYRSHPFGAEGTHW
jgi:hypothetical protein